MPSWFKDKLAVFRKLFVFSRFKKTSSLPNTCRAVQLYRPPRYFHLTVISPIGTILHCPLVSPQTLVQTFKTQLVEQFSMKDELQYFATSLQALTKCYVLLRVGNGNALRVRLQTLEEAGVQNNDEFHLIAKPKRVARKRVRNDGPRQFQIDHFTKDIAEVKRVPPAMNREHIKEINVKISIKFLVLHAAKLSAQIIGSGPLAAGLIESLQRKIAYEKQVSSATDGFRALKEMGFRRSAVKKGMQINNNNFTKTLAWLINNPVGTNIEAEDEISASESRMQRSESIEEAKNQSSNLKIKHINSLLEIVRVCNKSDLPHVAAHSMVTMMDMGFDFEEIRQAMTACRNNPSLACEWLCGDRESAIYEAETGFPRGSPIVKHLMENPIFQEGLENPKIFMAFLSILADYDSIARWFVDTDTSRTVIFMMNTFYEEKQIQSVFHILQVS